MSRSPLRILHTESSLTLGGQELRILAEASGMTARGHVVVLATPPRSPLAERARASGIPTVPVDMQRARLLPLVSEFMRLIRAQAIDVVNTHGSLDSWTASLAGRLSSRRPVIVRTRHKSTPISRTWRHQVLYRRLPHAVVTTGEVVRAHLVRDHGMAAAKVVSIPTGVDLAVFSPSAVRRTDAEAGRRGRVIGTVSFLRDYKGIDVLIEAARGVVRLTPDVTFWIIGEGPERHRIERMIAELGLQGRVELRGFREDVPDMLARMDVFALASIGGEGIPQALAQALAMARPVVATAVGGIPEVVEHEVTGLLVPPKDPDRLAEALLRLLRDPLLGETLGRAGRQRVAATLSLTGMLEKTEALYYRLLAARGCDENGLRK